MAVVGEWSQGWKTTVLRCKTLVLPRTSPHIRAIGMFCESIQQVSFALKDDMLRSALLRQPLDSAQFPIRVYEAAMEEHPTCREMYDTAARTGEIIDSTISE